MYMPTHFTCQDPGEARELIDRYPFATLVSSTGQAPMVTHLPLTAREEEGALVLSGHVARANPHWQMLPDAPTVAIFHGPHGYISPAWYPTPGLVPTWNYAAVHCHGAVTLIEDRASARALLEKLVAHFEAPRTQPWELRLEPAKLDALLGAIVAFEMRVERVEAKLKLGQNRSAQDRQGAIAGLAQEAGEPELIALMRRFAG